MPDDPSEIGDLDFAGEMHSLAYEAQSKATPPPAPRLDRKELLLALGQMVRPLALELENIRRATADNAVLLTILSKASKAAPAASTTPPEPTAPPPSTAEPEALNRINQQLQRMGSVETANQKLFDALYTELKGYKDGFLFDALQRPFIRDLVAIFDDFTAVHAQVSQRLAALDAGPDRHTGKNGHGGKAPEMAESSDAAMQSETEFLRNLAGNVDIQVHHLKEVFLRLDVTLSESMPGAALDKKSHRTVAFEPAATADTDAQVVRSLKPGFTWRDRMIRPEEVVVSRWSEDSAPPAAGASDPLPPAKKSVPDNKSGRAGARPPMLLQGEPGQAK